MKSPKVSILFPVYNVEKYLREAVDSILEQSFTDFEMIVLDDCSPDGSAAILDTYTDPRIVRYRGEKNQGLANVLNVGMDMARGEYIARMDSDDISLPHRLQVQVDYLDSHPEIDLCSCAMQLFGDRTEVWVRDAEPEAVKFRALFHSPILHASSMWRRESFSDLRFDQSYVPAEDYEMWTRALLAGKKIVNMPDVLYRYRIFGAGQASAQIEKSREKTFAVRKKFMDNAFPKASEELRNKAARLNESAEWGTEELKKVLADLVEANNQSQFFDSTFAQRCKRYYQSALYNEMLRHGVVWRKIGELRWRQIIKLLL